MNIYIELLPRARADIACALYLSTCFRNQKNETGCLYLHYAFFPDLFAVKWALYTCICMSSLYKSELRPFKMVTQQIFSLYYFSLRAINTIEKQIAGAS
jgi:hypothetical protein